jgi:XTP/dITP diphosphohydrolase
VTALNNQPGIYSARYAGPTKDFPAAMKRLHDELEGALDRSAHFICVLALAWPDGHHEILEGRVDGHLVWPPRGDNGHGYDPFFVPQGHTRTFGEMDADEKNAISHRAIAVRKLIKRLVASY